MLSNSAYNKHARTYAKYSTRCTSDATVLEPRLPIVIVTDFPSIFVALQSTLHRVGPLRIQPDKNIGGTYNPITLDSEVEDHRFEANGDYTVRSRVGLSNVVKSYLKVVERDMKYIISFANLKPLESFSLNL